MGKRKTDKPFREVKAYFRPEELDAMERFRERKTNLKSRNELFHTALQYYMRQVEQSGGIVDAKGFPVFLQPSQERPHPQDLVEQHPVRRPQSA